MTTTNERFDKKFAELPVKVFFALNGKITPIIKSFIQSEIELAKKEERKRIVEIIKNSRTVSEPFGVGLKEQMARDQVKADLITNNK